MGLDMYLMKAKRYKDTTAHEISVIEDYLSWKEAKACGNEYANCTLEKWCGVRYRDLPSRDKIAFYKKDGNGFKEVGYWRKANQIHAWFVDIVQNGVDDCGYHDEVTREVLEDLLDTCKTVLASCKLIEGKVENGYTFVHGNRVYEYVDGLVVEDPSVAEQLLPTQVGFFFGSYDYDEWYVEQIKDTIDIIVNLLATTNFDEEMIYYVSSW